MRSLPFKKYQTCELKSKIIDYRAYSLKICAFYLASTATFFFLDSKNDLILIMTPEKQDKTLELSKHWSLDSTPARNEVIMKRTYPVKSVKCDKICSNY